MYKISRILVMSFFLALCFSTVAQPRGPFFSSPQVHDDKTVTFRYHAPHADEVILTGQFMNGPAKMEKGNQGIWSVTVGPIEPDIYPYSFRVDGVTVMDPSNVDFFPNERFKGSLLNVPGDEPLIHSMQDVPHGTITYEYYPSVEGTTGKVVVYTPPNYDSNQSEKFPVFYLISGTTDTEEAWFKVGKTNLILDNLIAQGKAKPMIIVMPYGNIAARVAEQNGGAKPDDPMRGGDDAARRENDFGNDLVRNIIPYIDNTYRTIPDRNARAIGGFSRGGGQTLRAAFGNMDTFSWVCCYSAYLPTDVMESDYSHIASSPEKTNKDFNLLWVSVGDEDFLYEDTKKFMDYLSANNVNYKSLISGGGHTWMNTKLYLTETAQLLFK